MDKATRSLLRSFSVRLPLRSLRTARVGNHVAGYRPIHSLPRNPINTVPQSRQSPFHQLLARHSSREPIRHTLSKRFSSDKPPFNPTPNLGSPEPSLSLSQRLRKLSREYGWSALGVYLLLTALDFPFCFLAVRWIGTETIGHWESVIVEQFWKVFDLLPFRSHSGQPVAELESAGAKIEAYGVVEPNKDGIGVPGYDHGVKEAEERNKSEGASTGDHKGVAQDGG